MTIRRRMIISPFCSRKKPRASWWRRLRHAPSMKRKAKDLLRASGLRLLEKNNPHVAHETGKIRNGKALSPVLLVRGNAKAGLPLIVADGYHRICASWYRDENLDIVCRIVSRGASG